MSLILYELDRIYYDLLWWMSYLNFQFAEYEGMNVGPVSENDK